MMSFDKPTDWLLTFIGERILGMRACLCRFIFCNNGQFFTAHLSFCTFYLGFTKFKLNLWVIVA